jgi:hypothetical protein
LQAKALLAAPKQLTLYIKQRHIVYVTGNSFAYKSIITQFWLRYTVAQPSFIEHRDAGSSTSSLDYVRYWHIGISIKTTAFFCAHVV